MSVKKIIQAAAGASGPAAYVEDVFSTYLYTGNGSTQTITNGIDLTGKGGLVWVKNRSAANQHVLTDTVRGPENELTTNTTEANLNAAGLSAFLSNGFTVNTARGAWNANAGTYASWTFRKAPKFFDVVTYTGNGSFQYINHSLGSVPGMIIVKRTSSTGFNWYVYHRSTTYTQVGFLDNTSAFVNVYNSDWGNVPPTSTQFRVGPNDNVNGVGGVYVAYLFAHDAGGFGEAGDQSVVSCGSYTGLNSDVTVNLGWEPQYVLIKKTNAASDWQLEDNMRGMSMNTTEIIAPNLSAAAEPKGYSDIRPTPTGFIVPYANSYTNGAGSTFIYMAIRRGPMKKPTSGTQVFNALSRTGTSATATVSTTVLPDLVVSQARGGLFNVFYDRLRGANVTLSSTGATGTDADSIVTNGISSFNNNSYTVGTDASQNRINWTTYTYANWIFRRAPGFFDVVCYRGNGSTQNVSHNLTVAPNLIIVKNRTTAGTDWYVYSSAFPIVSGNPPENLYLFLNSAGAISSTGAWNYTAPTASVFSVAGGNNENANNYVAYLFATLPGVSKVGSYTGTGTTQQINCGFTTGARFVLIKRTDSTGDWYVWDSARGIVAGNDPYLLLNSTAAEVTTTDYIDPISSGFEISSTAPAAINASGGSFTYLAIS